MTRSHHPVVTAVVAVGVLLSACSSGESSDGNSTVPIPTAGSVPSTSNDPASTPATEPTSTTSTSTGAPTTDATTSTSEPAPTTTLVRPADLVTDPNDPNNLHTSLPEHQPIIDAYVAAINAELVTYSRWPLDPTSAELSAAPISDAMRTRENSGLVERTQLNQVLDISGGMTLRPYVVENDDPTRAFVWDCQIDATFWKDNDTGEKAPPDAWPNNGPPGVEVGVSAVMVLVDGEWLLDNGGLEPQACE
jgi:hypothetical protein